MTKNSMGLYISPGKHGSIQRNKYFERGKPCPVVVSVGQDPVLFMVSGNEIDYGVGEFDYAGGLKGAPIEVIEGKIDRIAVCRQRGNRHRRMDGPNRP